MSRGKLTLRTLFLLKLSHEPGLRTSVRIFQLPANLHLFSCCRWCIVGHPLHRRVDSPEGITGILRTCELPGLAFVIVDLCYLLRCLRTTLIVLYLLLTCRNFLTLTALKCLCLSGESSRRGALRMRGADIYRSLVKLFRVWFIVKFIEINAEQTQAIIKLFAH